MNCPKDWSGNVYSSPKECFWQVKGRNVIIIFVKEKGECEKFFLYAQLDRDGRNETESTHTM